MYFMKALFNNNNFQKIYARQLKCLPLLIRS